jgi:hypothetical protein
MPTTCMRDNSLGVVVDGPHAFAPHLHGWRDTEETGGNGLGLPVG